MTDPALLITAIVALAGSLLGGGGVVAWLKRKPEARKMEAESTHLIATAAAELMEQYSGRVADLTLQVNKLTERMHDMQREIDDLRKSLGTEKRLREVAIGHIEMLEGLVPPPPPVRPFELQ